MPMMDKEFLALRKENKGLPVKHRTSASALKTYKMCKRKWWLDKVRKLTTWSSKANVFGSITHAVCERFLLADDQGYDRETHEPVELYPEGWHISLSTYPEHVASCRGHKDHPDYVAGERFECDCPHPVEGELTIEEQALVKGLVSQAIDAGVLERHPGREVEAEIFYKAFHDDALGDMNWIGYIDVLEPDMIQDHKTTSRMKYALSKAKLFDDLQMNLYGYHACFVRKINPPDLEKMWFRHNVYCKDANDMRVRKTEVEKPLAEIKQYYDSQIEPCFRDMLLLIKNTNTWHDIEPPDDIAGSCNAYGGCPFLRICSGGETTDMYLKRVDRSANSGKKTNAKINPKETQTMNLMEKKKMKKNTTTPPSTAASTAATTEPVEQEVHEKQEALPANAAPWYIAGCKACSDNDNPGIGSNGQPCMICVSRNRGKIDVESYKQTVADDGTINWIEKASGETVLVDDSVAKAEIKTEDKVGNEADVEAEKAAKAAAAKKKAETQKAADAEVKAKIPPATKPSKGSKASAGDAEFPINQKTCTNRRKFTLILGGSSVDGTMSNGAAIGTVNRIVTLAEFMVVLGESMGEVYASKMGEEQAVNFYDINAFERRDFLCAHAGAIAEALGNSTLACPSHTTPDEATVVAALRPLAFRVFACSP